MENPNFSKFQGLVKEFSPLLYDFINLVASIPDSNEVSMIEKGGIKDYLQKFKKPFSITKEKFSLEGILAEIKKIYQLVYFFISFKKIFLPSLNFSKKSKSYWKNLQKKMED